MNQLSKLYMKNLWRWKCGLEEEPVLPNVHRVDITEDDFWCDERKQFVEYMKNRLWVGYYRYGELTKEAMKERSFTNLEHAEERIQKYKETHNIEYLIDVANGAMLEFLFPSYDDAYFEVVHRED